MPIVCIASEKGGVGKTTTTANLAAAFARTGATAVIDLDPQANLTNYFGVTTDADTIGTAQLLDPRHPASLADSLTMNVAGNIDLVAAVRAPLQATERTLDGEMGRELFLRRALAGITSIYDWVLIDTPPNTGLLVQNGLIASDAVLAVSDMDSDAAEGAATVAGMVSMCRNTHQVDCRFLGVLWTRVKANRELNRYVEADLAEAGLNALPQCIHERAAIQKAKYQHRTIVDLAPASPATAEFLTVAATVSAALTTTIVLDTAAPVGSTA